MTITSLSHRRLRGQSGIEFFFTFVVFIVMFLSLGDMVRVATNWVAMQYASNRGIRAAKLIPTRTPNAKKVEVITNEIIARSTAVGMPLTSGNINVQITNTDVTVETHKDVSLSPVTGLILSFGGDHSGVYSLKVREAMRNDAL